MTDHPRVTTAFTSFKAFSWFVLALMAITILFTAWQSIRHWTFIAV